MSAWLYIGRERDRVRTRRNGGASWQKSRTSGFKLAQSYGLGDSPFRFLQRAIKILRSITKLSTLSWYFRSLSDFFLKHFHDGLRKQGRKAVKRAFHFLDRGKNAWLYQIFECKVNTVISNFSVNIFSLKCS